MLAATQLFLPEVAATMVLAMAGFRFRGDHGAFRGGERSEATIVAAARTEQTDLVFSLVSKPVRCS
jgi:hypothetical protein